MELNLLQPVGHQPYIVDLARPQIQATFKVYLPVSEDAHIEKEEVKKTAADLSGTETVLIVEDDEQIRHLTQAILKRQGYTFITAENGAEALSVLERHDGPVHLLLTDVIMPDMNGRDQFARVSERYPEPKVLYMSGYTDNVIAHHGVLEEGVNFIQKPFSVQGIASKIREVLDQK